MIEFKGTPGPWELGTPEQQGEGLHVPIHGTGHGELAMVVWQMADDKFDRIRSVSCEANASLIAAAPEMLSMLFKARYWAQMAATPDERRELADLIAKATSNSN